MEIAEKLRRFGEHIRGGGLFNSSDTAELLKQAAEEIERLQKVEEAFMRGDLKRV